MTPKQERFIAEYCIDLNGTQAAIRAGCSPRSANRTASKWLSKADISREIAQRTKQQLEAAQLSAVRTLEELRRVVIASGREDKSMTALPHAAHAVYQPNKVVLGTAGPVESFAKTLPAKDGKATAYVCVGTACSLPTHEPEKLKELLK